MEKNKIPKDIRVDACMQKIDQELDEMLINITTEAKKRIRNVKILKSEVLKTL